MKRKSLKTILLLIFGLFFALNIQACEIKFKVVGDEKESYQVGDEVVVAVTVVYTHRVCPEGIKKTKFNFTGVEALGATPWKEITEGKYTRKLKLKVTEQDKNKHLLSAVRTCDKDGGSGSITIKVQ